MLHYLILESTTEDLPALNIARPHIFANNVVERISDKNRFNRLETLHLNTIFMYRT